TNFYYSISPISHSYNFLPSKLYPDATTTTISTLTSRLIIYHNTPPTLTIIILYTSSLSITSPPF
ncbi:hypothetical protein, partial [Staphylococcus hominis]|uniref:hypothetical protein n=1 Tax=Staphylococcus hominis TaxID=1290 RepID=UPI001C92EB65